MNSRSDGQESQEQTFGNHFIESGASYNNVYPLPKVEYFQPMGIPTSQYNMTFSINPHTPSSENRSETPPSFECSQQLKKKACVPVPEDKKDEAYWNKRHKNNESARRSREQKKVRAAKVAEEIANVRLEIAQYEQKLMMAKHEHDYYSKEYQRLYAMLCCRTT